MNKAIELKDVSFCYEEDQPILEHVSFSINHGELVLLSGHSGEGKSTILNILSGIIPNINYGYLKGDVLIDGKSIINQKIENICRKVGVVLQNADSQIIQKIVEDEIAFSLENLAFPKEKMENQIELVTNMMKLDRKAECRSLSGGQKQRLITASTLAMGQKILLLDEPLANLDKEGGRNLMTTLKKLAQASYAIIVIEHRLDMVLPYADRVLDLHEGKISEVEAKDDYLKKQTRRIEDACTSFDSDTSCFSLKQVSYKVKEKTILKDINVDFLKGRRSVILGENGCGKTTLLRLISKLSKPSDGMITQNFDPSLKNKKRGSRKWFKKVGVIYQNPDYQLFMPTVKKELLFSAFSEEYALEIAEIFELTSLFDRHPQSLSEGQKRRLSIAAIMAGKPDVVLLDEPTVGQDYDFLEKLVTALNNIHEKTKNTMITITHDVRCATALCDDAILIKDGVVFKKGGKELVDSYFLEN